jgi:hypothetical protein
MQIKITLIKPIQECKEFNSLLTKYNLKAENIFKGNEKKFRIHIEARNPEAEKQIHDCPEVFDFIIKENLETEDEPI